MAQVLLTPSRKTSGSGHTELILAREVRPKGMGLIRKKGRSFYPRTARE